MEKPLMQDEITLYELLLVIRKRVWLILALFIVSIVIASILPLRTRDSYQGSFTVVLPTVHQMFVPEKNDIISFIAAREVQQCVTDLNGYIANGEYARIRSLLDISEEDAESLLSVSVKRLEDKNSVSDFMEITINLSSPTPYKKIEEQLLKYMNQHIAGFKRMGFYKENLIALRGEMMGKIQEIDAAREAIPSLLKQGRTTEKESIPIGIDSKLIRLRQQMMLVDHAIRSLNGLEVASEKEEVALTTPAVKRKLLIIMAGALSVFAGIVFAFILEWFAKVKKGYHQQSP
jgi:hypothetical protein